MFLKSANISEQQQQLVKATIPKISYAEVTKKLGSLFLETASSADDCLPVKLEPNSTYMVSQPNFPRKSNRGGGSRSWGGSNRIRIRTRLSHSFYTKQNQVMSSICPAVVPEKH